MSDPLVSCICPTFGRAPKFLNLLQEMLYWFTRQTYDNRELIIYNDAPNQRIICNVPRVRVINSASKIETLGDKYNAMCAEAKGDIIMPWEDDDIALPHRIAQAVEKLSSSGSDYFNPGGSWYEEAETAGMLRDGGGVCLNAGAFYRGLWWRTNGFPAVTGNQDAAYDSILRQHGRVTDKIDRKEWSYVYRWGRSDLHLSAYSNPNDPMAMQRKYIEAKSEEMIVVLTPRMFQDYESLYREAIKCCGGKCKKECAKS